MPYKYMGVGARYQKSRVFLLQMNPSTNSALMKHTQRWDIFRFAVFFPPYPYVWEGNITSHVCHHFTCKLSDRSVYWQRYMTMYTINYITWQEPCNLTAKRKILTTMRRYIVLFTVIYYAVFSQWPVIWMATWDRYLY